MDSTSFPGASVDDHGSEAITWRVLPATLPSPGRVPGYELSATIRGAEVRGLGPISTIPGTGYRGSP